MAPSKRRNLLRSAVTVAGMVLITIGLTPSKPPVPPDDSYFGEYTQKPDRTSQISKGRGDRAADDGEWFEQTSPFRIVAYTAFYDDRLTLNSSGPRVVAIVQSARQIDCCVIWFEKDEEETRPGWKATQLGPSLIGCQLPAYLNSTPISVSFCWRNSRHVNSGTRNRNEFTATTFRVPIESVGKISASSGMRIEPAHEIVLCLGNLHGEIDPLILIEWIEMNFILGISRIVIYNHSASNNTVEVLQQYADTNDSFVELRQSKSTIIDDSEYGHQDPTLHDCFYRHAGLFQYVAIWDFDELVVPRQPNSKLLDLVKIVSGSEGIHFGAFEFRNVYFHLEFPPMSWNVSNSSNSADSYPQPSSRFLSRRQRGGVWPHRFVMKDIMRTESCVVPWTHGCRVWTDAYEVDSPTVIRELDVSPIIALKHHYRYCRYDALGGNCEKDRLVSRPDDVMLRYADELAVRLRQTYSRLNLHVAPAQNT